MSQINQLYSAPPPPPPPLVGYFLTSCGVPHLNTFGGHPVYAIVHWSVHSMGQITHCTPSPLPCIDLILLVAFPRRTLWGSPGICDCTLTNAFPRVKGLRVWDPCFCFACRCCCCCCFCCLTNPLYRHPHTVFGVWVLLCKELIMAMHNCVVPSILMLLVSIMCCNIYSSSFRCSFWCLCVVTQPTPWCSCWCQYVVTQPTPLCSCWCHCVVTQPTPLCSCWCQCVVAQPTPSCSCWCRCVVTQPKAWPQFSCWCQVVTQPKPWCSLLVPVCCETASAFFSAGVNVTQPKP